MVYRSQTPLLDSAAIDAVKKWVYEPLVIDGNPVEAVFTTNVRFKLKPEKTEKAAVTGGVVGGVLKLGDSVERPKIIKKVSPIYPEEAKKNLVQGVVVLEVTTDEEGNVAEAKVVRSDSSLLNQASLDAVKQWKYEPMMSKGKPVRLSFNVTLTFRLR
jgi:protein TonB